MKAFRVPSRRHQQGAIAIIVAFSMFVLIGFAGLALDGGRLYLSKTELQNAADACALSASYELAGAPNIPASAFTNATNAGMLVATKNRVDFQASAIDPQDVTIEFGTSLTSGAWLTAASTPPGNSKYVRCTLQETGIVPWFMQVLGFGATTMRAMATASLENAQTNCGIPLGVCTKGPAPNYGLTKGQWVDGRFDAGGGATGSYNWIDFSPPSGGESELAGLLTGNGVCDMNVNNNVGQTGLMGNSAAQAWNSRFGLYQGKIDFTDPSKPTPTPDRTGYAYSAANWPSKFNALDDFLTRRATNDPYDDAATGLGIKNAYKVLTNAQHNQYGADRRLAVAPLVDCGGWATAQTVPIVAWVCVLMLQPIADTKQNVVMEFEGLASDPSSPCATSGVVGGAGSVGPLVPGLVQ
jgi:hypothetical protein